MFFQRFFKRKRNFYNNHNNNHKQMYNYNDDIDTKCVAAIQERHKSRQRQQCAYTSPKHRAATQLTPLWEHILRTRTLPEHICPSTIYAEFLERLRDPEWQVRQHALRVLVDVLVVMRQAADAYMQPLVPQLVENLGHAAPTVRKGALDCLRVYLMESSRPEKILQQILNIGLNECVTDEPLGGRLTCGVLLSIPALVQSTLQTEQRPQILQTTISMLLERMKRVNDQEITLKVLNKLWELVGDDEFREYLSSKEYRDLQLLTNIYDVKPNLQRPSKWQMAQVDRESATYWRTSSTEDDQGGSILKGATLAKIIMETEIKINDDTLTMRLLEADETLSSAAENSEDYKESEVIYGNLAKPAKLYRALSSYSDSEVDDINIRRKSSSVPQILTPVRTPKRVTFGGEIVKVRTPDSDATSSGVNNKTQKETNTNHLRESFATIIEQTETQNMKLVANNVNIVKTPNGSNSLTALNAPVHKTSALSVDIPNDNTKPLQQIQTTEEIQRFSPHQRSPPSKRLERSPTSMSLSPRLSHKRLSISSVESNISPKTPHKEIEVLHNLQRDPSPSRVKRLEILSPSDVLSDNYIHRTQNEATQTGKNERVEHAQSFPLSWEDLDIVDNEALLALKSGVSDMSLKKFIS